MNGPVRFDMFGPLAPGRRLIESSAGTGKTYTIASLYVRLLLERRLQVGQILVVTFTKPATEELKRRIRRRIREALSAIEGAPTDDDFIRRLADAVDDRAAALEALGNALRMFDEAAIFTIHGFCGRMLQENAFESASLFDTELVTDESDIRQEIADDFYRLHVHGAFSPLFLPYALANGFEPGALASFIKGNAARPFLKIVPGPGEEEGLPSPDALERAFLAARNDAVSAWNAGREEASSMLEGHEGLNRNKYRAPTVAAMISAMDEYAKSPPSLDRFRNFGKLRSSALREAARKGHATPAHPFFDAFEALHDALDALEARYRQRMIGLRLELAEYARRELAARKARRNVRSYDDLMHDLFDALRGGGGEALAETVRNRFHAALIDEFQDTDPVQYEIFSTIFPDRSSLFLIGDPKQAIYGFRGAEIFAYLKAAGEVGERFTLDRNFRSVPELVEAVNTVFGRREGAFVFPEIGYPRVEAASDGGEAGFAWKGIPDPAPFKIRMVGRPDASSTEPIHKGFANHLLPRATASEIVSLLDAGSRGEATIGGKPVTPRDIAVLVRTNDQARAVHAALRQRGVPSVVYSSESVFASVEASELERVLSAVADPGHDGKLRAALSTGLFGVDGNELARLRDDERGWEVRIRQFAEWGDLWAAGGFIAMVRSLAGQAGVRRRLLSQPDGERRLTNLGHLFELVHEAAHARRLGVEGLLKWLAERRADTAGIPAEEHQLRLETDETAVKVVTVHKCKGLEYPIVYCPFAWDVYGGDGDGVSFHDPADLTTLVRDIGSDRLDEHRVIARREALAENARLLYVALTRAKYRCVVAWGALKDAGGSSLAMLLHAGGVGRIEGDPGFPARFSGMTDAGIRSDLDRLAAESGGTIEVTALPLPTDRPFEPPVAAAVELSCRIATRPLSRDWGVASFTSLVSGAEGESGWTDRDAVPVPGDPPDPVPDSSVPEGEPTFFDFPKGAKAGLFFHGLMETLDFSAPDEEVARAVGVHLAAGGFDPAWRAPVSRAVRRVLDTPLDPADGAFRLSALPTADRIHEVEFAMPLDLLTPAALRTAFEGPEGDPGASARIDRLAFPPVRGMLKGYIDMVFTRGERYYLLDWKTNHLGHRIADYGQDAMREEMGDSFYFLQYHLYAVALDRYLRLRVPGYDYGRHFGGVFYLFVRGMDPASGPGFGVCFDRPPAGRIAALGRLLSREDRHG